MYSKVITIVSLFYLKSLKSSLVLWKPINVEQITQVSQSKWVTGDKKFEFSLITLTIYGSPRCFHDLLKFLKRIFISFLILDYSCVIFFLHFCGTYAIVYPLSLWIFPRQMLSSLHHRWCFLALLPRPRPRQVPFWPRQLC